MSFDGAKVRRFWHSHKLFEELCAKTARFLTQIKDISFFIITFAPTYIIIYMEQKNRFISATYELYTVANGMKVLMEQTSQASPFEFITGFGIALDAFEQNLIGLEKGTLFNFTLQPEEAFGNYDPNGVIKMDREAFTIDGKFDHQHIFPNAIITLVNSEQQYQMASVVAVESNGVTLDMNHPYAGKVLNFIGMVRENREATEEEIQKLIRQLTGDCGCGGCGGDCGDDGCDCQKSEKKGKGCHGGGCCHN